MLMIAPSATSVAGVVTFSLPKDTRPSAISFSASRREQIPARAMIFAMRSPLTAELVSSLNAWPFDGAVQSGRSSRISHAMTTDDEFYRIALAEAEAAGARGEVPVGAVLVSAEGAVLARGGNRTLGHRDPTAHAEILVLRAAAALVGNERLIGTVLYVTLEPCTMCVGAISFARVARLVYGAADSKGGAVEHGARFFEQPTCHHRPHITRVDDGGVSSRLLTEFFRARRR